MSSPQQPGHREQPKAPGAKPAKPQFLLQITISPQLVSGLGRLTWWSRGDGVRYRVANSPFSRNGEDLRDRTARPVAEPAVFAKFRPNQALAHLNSANSEREQNRHERRQPGDEIARANNELERIRHRFICPVTANAL
jgi:hypothetical protein